MALAALVLCGPLLYGLTDRPVQPTWWRFSKRQLLWTALYGAAFVAVVGSYRLAVPALVERLRASLVMVAATLLATWLLGELALRALEPAPRFEALPRNDRRHAPDPDVGHVFAPNQSLELQTGEFRSTWRTNGEGVRADRDYGPKAAGVFRVLVIGDSFTAGGQVSLAETYPGILEAELATALGEGAVEVINAGHPAYGTVHAARWVGKFASHFQPDLIVHGMTPNDLSENLRPLLVTAEDGQLRWKTSTDAHRTRWEDRQQWYSVPGWVDRSLLVQRLRGAPLVRRLTHSQIYPHHHVYQLAQDAASRDRYALAYEHLGLLREHAQGLGARLALVVIPFREQLTELHEGLDPRAYGRRIAAWGAAHGVPVIDTLEAFRSHPDPASLYWRKDAHCTAAGYRLVGETLAAGLLARGAEVGLSAGPGAPEGKGPALPGRSTPPGR